MTSDEDIRPSPDQLLSAIQKAEKKPGRGQLKVFLGMAAGVGKTFAMLQRAHQLAADGVDVLVGWVDTHGRKDTAKLLDGLAVFPRRAVDHKGVTLEEMDLDGLLKRKPKVAIVDELAHSNAPGSRFAKRYEDVRELLSAGIDVFTAVNIQHVESRVDTVREITGVSVQERVPDSFLDEADEIVLIDLPPEDLLQRLKDGRVYAAEKAELAGRNFFKLGNLTALRELALRTATGRVDRELREFKTLHGIDAAWKSSSRLMVAVFASPYSEALVRWTRQLAETMGATWLGAYVDDGRPLSDLEKRLLERNTQLVRRLGGDFASIQDQSLVNGLLRLARQNHVTQLVVGKSQRGRLRNMLSGGSVVNRLLRRSGDIDVYVVSPERRDGPRLERLRAKRRELVFPWGEAGWAVAAVMAVWLLAGLVLPYVGYQSVAIVFLMAVLGAGVVFSRITVFAIALSLSFIHNFFFIPPLYTLAIREPQDVLMHLMFFVAATAVGHLTTRLRRQNRIIVEREDRAVQLFNLAHAIAEALGVDDVVRVGVEALSRNFGAEVAVVLYSGSGTASIAKGSSYTPPDKELAVADWARQNGAPAGKFTETLPSAEALYLPLRSRKVVMGVVALRPSGETHWEFERRNFAQALAGQLAAGLERERLHQARQQLEVLEQADRLYRTLFDSVSHELKTPLTTIKGAASMMAQTSGSPAQVPELSEQIEGEADRLIHVVDNMLDMTRLESGAVRPRLELYDLADVLGPALQRIESIRGSRDIRLDVPVNVPTLRCDAPLAVQALSNVLHNAIVHTSPRGRVEVSVAPSGAFVEVRVRDRGPGLPTDDPAVVFERFYRERPNQSGGVGLGLSIAKGFLEAQGGSISASNHPSGGAEFLLRIPAAVGKGANDDET